MFVPMPIAPMPVIPQHFYNKYEKIDPEQESAQFVATEGTYKPIEELHIAYPAPHPSEPPPNPNPLTPYAAPLHSGMHLSILSPGSKKIPRQVEAAIIEEEKKTPTPKGSLSDSGSDDQHPSTSAPLTPIQGQEFYRSSSTSTGGGELHTVTTGVSSVFDNNNDAYLKRKRRTGTSANGTTSTFVSRAIVDPALSTRLAEHKKSSVFIFSNIARSLSWFDTGSTENLKHEPLSKLLFSVANVVCHDINEVTSTDKTIEVILGTTSGDICWYDPATTRYLRYNKQRCINPTAVTCIKWLPGSENLFMAAHADGALVLYDKDREDSDFLLSQDGDTTTTSTNANSPLNLLRSAHDTRHKTNPVSYMALSRQTINAFAFSPDSTHLAVVSDDGCLKILDYRQERLLDVFSSYYGGLTCVTWSPDGQYIVTGGKDDIVSVWSFTHRCILARGHGHSSWVSGVAFDPWLCDGQVSRIGSVSEDGKLCLWDLSLSSLHKPSSRKSRHVVPVDAAAGRPVIANAATSAENGDVAQVTFERDGVVYHRAESRLSTAILSPVTVKQVDDQPPSHLVFLQDRILIATTGKKYGHIKSWSRPDTDSTIAAAATASL